MSRGGAGRVWRRWHLCAVWQLQKFRIEVGSVWQAWCMLRLTRVKAPWGQRLCLLGWLFCPQHQQRCLTHVWCPTSSCVILGRLVQLCLGFPMCQMSERMSTWKKQASKKILELFGSEELINQWPTVRWAELSKGLGCDAERSGWSSVMKQQNLPS